MTPQGRVTFFHSSLPVEGVVVTEPAGLEDLILQRDRHPVYSSLVRMIEGNFLWMGTALQIIKEVKAAFGFNSVLTVHIDISYKRNVWENIFTGQLSIKQFNEAFKNNPEKYQASATLIQEDFWTRFINGLKKSVPLGSNKDIFGNPRTVIDKIVLPMPSQKIHSESEYYELAGAVPTSFANPLDEGYIQLGFADIILDEAKDHQNIPTSRNPELPVGFWRAKYDGVYSFDISVSVSSWTRSLVGSGSEAACLAGSNESQLYESVEDSFDFYYKRNDEEPVVCSKDHSPLVVLKRGTKFFLQVNNVNLKAGDQIKVYGVANDGDWIQEIGDFWSQNLIIWGRNNSAIYTYTWAGREWTGSSCVPTDFGAYPIPFDHGDIPQDLEPSRIFITADTIFEDTETDAYILKDALESIASKIIGQDNCIKSNFLDTCRGWIALFRGKHNRGYTFDEKEMFMSWEEGWEADALLNLGLGQTTVLGVKKLEIEPKRFFWDPVPAVNLFNITNLERRYDLEKCYTSAIAGFKSWSSESDSGMDDTQTTRKFNNDIPHDEEFKTECGWLAASMPIEQGRRLRVEKVNDHRDDEKIIMVAVQPNGENWIPEFGTAFNFVGGLLNSDFRLNIRHSATRIFQRWKNWIDGCMAYSITGVWTLGSAEGNYEMQSQFEVADCEASDNPEPILTENADQEADVDNALFVPEIYEFKDYPLTKEVYDLLLANEKKAIGISRTDVNPVPMHILTDKFSVFKGRLSGILILATEQTIE